MKRTKLFKHQNRQKRPPTMLPEPLPVPLAAHIDLTLPSSISLVDERRPARRVDGARALPDDEAFWAIHEEVARLGRGCFGSVLHVRDHASGRMAAAKVVASSAARDDDECPLREPELLSLANHQHVVQLLDVFQSSSKGLFQSASRRPSSSCKRWPGPT